VRLGLRARAQMALSLVSRSMAGVILKVTAPSARAPL
jgi:hypothetical protein